MKLTKIGNEYTLRNEAGDQLTLTAQELAELVRDGHHILDRQAKFRPLATMTAKDIAVSIDAHHSQAILRFQGEGSREDAYEIAGEHVRRLAEALIKKAELIEAALSKKTEH